MTSFTVSTSKIATVGLLTAGWGASFSWEKIRALGGAAAALGAELLGIAAVKRGCFR
jgi:hypothetical protein